MYKNYIKNNLKVIILTALFLTPVFIVGWIGVLFFLYSVFVLYIVYYYKPREDRKPYKLNKKLLIIPIIIFLASRILPFALYGEHPLGYDTGFYNYNIQRDRDELDRGVVLFEKNADGSGVVNIGEMTSFGTKLINKFFIVLGFNNQVILYWFYIFIGLASLVLVYAIARDRFGENAALYSAMLYSFSFTQFLAYWFMLWKNAVGLCLILLIIYLSDKTGKKNSILTVFLFLFLIITHKTSAFLIIMIYVLYALSSGKMSKKLIPAGLFLLSLIAALYREDFIYLYQQVLSNFSMYYDAARIRGGVFIGISEYIKYAIFYLPFSFVSVAMIIKNRKKNAMLLAFFMTTFLIVATRFIFYRRMIIFLDVALILFFGYGFSLFINKVHRSLRPRQAKIVLLLIFLLPLFLYFSGIIRTRPGLSKPELNVIISIRNRYPGIRILTADTTYSSWLYGFSGHEVISPGWINDKWTLKKWQAYWSADDASKENMLRELKESLLIYSKKPEPFQKIAQDFYLFRYNN